MLEKPDPQVAHALYRLGASDDWKSVRAWILEELGRLRQENDFLYDEIALRQSQGACRTLASLIEWQDKSIDIVRKA